MFKSDSQITQIGEGLRDSSLTAEEFTHAAHVAAAVWLFDQYGSETYDLMPGMIRSLNIAAGGANTDSEGYHHTITMASLKAIEAKAGEGSLCERTNRLLSLGYGRSDWLLQHYSKDRLFSLEARRGWIEPDLAPLPKG